MTNWLDYLQWGTPIIGAVVGCFAGRYGRKSDSLMKMQETIDMLVMKNQELTMQVTELRQENARLQQEQASLKAQINSLTTKKNKTTKK